VSTTTASRDRGPEIQGRVAPRFAAVRDVLARSFRDGSEQGCGLTVWHEGEIVVDLWGGARDREQGLPYEADTLCTMFSTTKGMVALCFLMLADRGRLDYDAPVSEHWPAFGQGEKRGITVRTLLNHRSGLVGLTEPLTLDQLEHQPEEVVAILERQRPAWEPGTSQGYHGITFGLYAAELFRRIAGESVGTFFAREVARPLGADVYIGLPEALEARCAKIYPVSLRERLLRGLPGALFERGTEARVLVEMLRKGDTYRAFTHPEELGPSGLESFNTRRVRAMELLWANGLGSARGLCRVYSALANGGAVDGVRLVRSETIAPVMERQSWSERDRVLQKPLGWSQGFLKEETTIFSPSTESFGHSGAGGALGWCDPKRGLSIAYLTVNMAHHVRSPRALALCRAIYASLGSA
jgi:CubicO group peptidase (beta-lactamase class C family)